jgi:two-component system, response regulator
MSHPPAIPSDRAGRMSLIVSCCPCYDFSVAKEIHGLKAESVLQSRLGAIVRARRDQLGITQAGLARLAHMNQACIANIEHGARNLTVRSLANLAKALRFSVENLFPDASARSGASLGAAWRDDTNGTGEILLVDGNATDAKLARRAFKRASLANPLTVVSNGTDALDYLSGTGRHARQGPARPQLILLALNLRGMSGIEFLRHIKKETRRRKIVVVVLSGSHRDSDVIECRRLGARHHLVKPLRFEDFIGIIPKLNLHLTLGAVGRHPKKGEVALNGSGDHAPCADARVQRGAKRRGTQSL